MQSRFFSVKNNFLSELLAMEYISALFLIKIEGDVIYSNWNCQFSAFGTQVMVDSRTWIGQISDH